MASSVCALSSNPLTSLACASAAKPTLRESPPPPLLKLPPPQLLGSRLHLQAPTSSLSSLRSGVGVGSGTHHQQLTVCKVSKGDTVPPFTLKDQNGRNVSLSQYKGKPVVLYFYPGDDTPGCTKQACAFRDSYEKFKKAGAEVLGVSGDSADSHKKFAAKYKLPFTLLVDEGNKLRKEWGIPGDFFGSLPGRQTYVIDKKGVVQLIFNNQFQPEKHIDQTLKFLQSI